MKRDNLMYLFLLLGIVLWFPIRAQSPLQKASLGSIVLENGQVIENCQLGYRTFGTLNQDR